MPRLTMRWMGGVLALILVGLTACEPPLDEPGEVSTISKVSSTTADGWRYDFYRNTAYPCSISGYQTFLIATKTDSSPTATRPLWVYMHGGGVGYFSPDGVPRAAEGRPSEMFMREESAEDLRAELQKGELMRRVRAEPTGFRMVAVSMCNRDIYGGDDTPDPNNPNTTPDGEPRTANGLFATKATVQYTQGLYPTDDYFLHGTSAGSYGAYHVSWGLQQQGLPAAGIVADSGVLNPPWNDAQVDGENCAPPEAARAIIDERLHPDIGDPDNAPDLLVASDRLTVPILQVWTRGDFLGCGEKPMQCPLRDGSTPTMGSVDCQNEPMRASIAAQGPESRSLSMRLCVDLPQRPDPCDMHVPTAREGLNTDPAWPADFTGPIMDWVRARQADEGPPAPPPTTTPPVPPPTTTTTTTTPPVPPPTTTPPVPPPTTTTTTTTTTPPVPPPTTTPTTPTTPPPTTTTLRTAPATAVQVGSGDSDSGPAPRGGVATGGGGTASQSSSAPWTAVAGVGLVALLVAGLTLRLRRQ